MPVHSINTFLVFTLIFVWSPKTCEDKNVLRNVITFLAMILTPSVIQKDRCHLPQLKKPPTFTILTRIAALFIFKFINQREEKDRPDSLTRLCFTLKDTQIYRYLSIHLKKQTSGTVAICWLRSSSAPPEHLTSPGFSNIFASDAWCA